MRNPKLRYVAYYRVSTAKQGRSGLGLEAQREAVARYLNGDGREIIAEFTEVESGKRRDRPELEKALAAARLHRCPLVVAKVDRLTRSVSFLSRLLEAGVDVRFADLPAIEGPTGRFMLQQMAAVAELEAGEQNKGGTCGRESTRKGPWRQPGCRVVCGSQSDGACRPDQTCRRTCSGPTPDDPRSTAERYRHALRARTSAERARRPNGTWWVLLDGHPGRTGLRATAVNVGPL
jgi:Resolvase, N terminal domain